MFNKVQGMVEDKKVIKDILEINKFLKKTEILFFLLSICLCSYGAFEVLGKLILLMALFVSSVGAFSQNKVVLQSSKSKEELFTDFITFGFVCKGKVGDKFLFVTDSYILSLHSIVILNNDKVEVSSLFKIKNIKFLYLASLFFCIVLALGALKDQVLLNNPDIMQKKVH